MSESLPVWTDQSGRTRRSSQEDILSLCAARSSLSSSFPQHWSQSCPRQSYKHTSTPNIITNTPARPISTRVVHRLGRPTRCVGLGRRSETVPKNSKNGKPIVTAEVIPDRPNLIMINTDKWVIPDKLSLDCDILKLSSLWSKVCCWSYGVPLDYELWVGLVCGSKVCTLRWVGLCWRNWTHGQLWYQQPVYIYLTLSTFVVNYNRKVLVSDQDARRRTTWTRERRRRV